MNFIKDWIQGFDPVDGLYWVVLGTGLVVLLATGIILSKVAKAIKNGKPETKSGLITKVVFGLALLINAEGMYFVATDKMGLPSALALGTFFVFELLQINSMRLAAQHYRDKDQDPGPHATVVWAIALISGVIVMFNSKNAVEAMVRLALPLAVAIIWRVNLTAGDQPRKQKVGKFAYSPSRLLANAGLLVAEDNIELDRISRERKIKKLVALSHRIESGGLLRTRRVSRLKRIAMVTEKDVLDAASAQLNAGRQAIEILVPEAAEKKSETDSEIKKLTDQLASRGISQSGSQSPVSRGQSPSQLDGPVSWTSRQLGSDQSGDQSAIEGSRQLVSQDDQLIEQLREAADGRYLAVQAAIRVITPDGVTPRCGSDRAKRLLTRAGLTWERDV